MAEPTFPTVCSQYVQSIGEAIRSSWRCLSFAHPDLCNDKEVVRIALRPLGMAWYGWVLLNFGLFCGTWQVHRIVHKNDVYTFCIHIVYSLIILIILWSLFNSVHLCSSLSSEMLLILPRRHGNRWFPQISFCARCMLRQAELARHGPSLCVGPTGTRLGPGSRADRCLAGATGATEAPWNAPWTLRLSQTLHRSHKFTSCSRVVRVQCISRLQNAGCRMDVGHEWMMSRPCLGHARSCRHYVLSISSCFILHWSWLRARLRVEIHRERTVNHLDETVSTGSFE